MTVGGKQAFDVADIVPDGPDELDLSSGKDSRRSEYVADTFRAMAQAFCETARPVGITRRISTDKFARLYSGNAKHRKDTPVSRIFPRADALALFAFTLGVGVGEKVGEWTRANKVPEACMLDSMASFAVEQAARIAEHRLEGAVGGEETRALLYSPGHCGWHISAQRELFDYLRPEDIGITLSTTFLMSPLKSVSGILIAGKPGLHVFDNNFTFCRNCKTRICRKRMAG
jgi:hypothetical protein